MSEQFQMHCPKCLSHSFTVRRDQRAYIHKSQPFELVFSCRCGKQLFGDQIQKEYDRQKSEWDSDRGDVVPSVTEDDAFRKAEKQRREDQLRNAMEYRRKYLAEKRKEQMDAERVRKDEEERVWREKVARVEAEERKRRRAAATAAANKGGRSTKRPKPTPPKQKAAPTPPTKAPAAPPPQPTPTAAAATVDPEHPHAEFMPLVADGTFEEFFPGCVPPDKKSPELCIWPPCEKPRRKRSKYCSRECSNKNARWRHKLRKRKGEAA